jgi:deoxyribodipyrimidine photo-lyase
MSDQARPAVWWVRRDFRLADNPALRAAIDEGAAVLPLFVLDPVLLASAGTARKAWLLAALHALDQDLQEAGAAGLSVVDGRPVDVVPRVARCTSVPTSDRTVGPGTRGWRQPSPDPASS